MISEQMREKGEKAREWVYDQCKNNTYRSANMKYAVSRDRTDVGPVLVSFRVPYQKRKKDGTISIRYRARPSASTGDLTLGMMRRCVPYSQIEAVLEYSHTGMNNVAHLGQDATWWALQPLFDGITREMARVYVTKCHICQLKQQKTHKAALVPIVSKALWERVVMDLIDYNSNPSYGFRYIWHAVDHFSKFHFAQPIPNKEAKTIAACVETMLSFTGPVPILQCDNGREFWAETIELCPRWSMPDPRNSSPYHPQTNGLVERGNSVLKRALSKWMASEGHQDWALGVHRVIHQINCTPTTTTRIAPFQLVFGMAPRREGLLRVGTPAIDHTDMLAIMTEEEKVEERKEVEQSAEEEQEGVGDEGDQVLTEADDMQPQQTPAPTPAPLAPLSRWCSSWLSAGTV
jgi:hypothetical protein